MKHNLIYTLLATVCLALGLASCSEDDGQAAAGTYVDFTVGSADTRTVRDASNKYQINWLDDDKVRVYCKQTDKEYADYTVKRLEETLFKGKLEYGADGLKWSDEYRQHHFYAVYPSDAATAMSSGQATFKVLDKQEVTVPSAATDGAYVCAPTMTNAYMVASCDAYNGSQVPLSFKPIMTTLDVTVANTTSASVPLTGVTLIDENASYQGASAGTFTVKCSDGSLVGTETATTQHYYVTFKDGNDYFDLPAGQSVTFTVFLPPVPVSSAHPLKVRVQAAGSYNVSTTLGAAADKNGNTLSFAASSLGNIKLTIKNADTYNNWISDLDGNILVQQLSIPGTNQSLSYSVGSDTYSQRKDLTAQLKMGIRAFVFRGYKGWGNENFTVDCDGVQSSATVKSAVQTISSFLDANPNEFVVIQVEKAGTSSLGTWNDNFYRVFENVLGSKLLVWNKNLKVSEARGHVIGFFRYYDDGGNNPEHYDNMDCAGLSQFSKGNPDATVSITGYTNGSTNGNTGTCRLFVQNGRYTDDEASASTKIANVKSFWDNTIPNTDYYTNRYWAINYVGCSTAASKIAEGYLNNAQYVHKNIYSYIRDLSTTGPLGIVFMDWVGYRKYPDDGSTYNGSTFNVYGDILPQAIIANNFRFTMKQGN